MYLVLEYLHFYAALNVLYNLLYCVTYHVAPFASINQSIKFDLFCPKSQITICLGGLYNLHVTTPFTFRSSNRVRKNSTNLRQGKMSQVQSTTLRPLLYSLDMKS